VQKQQQLFAAIPTSVTTVAEPKLIYGSCVSLFAPRYPKLLERQPVLVEIAWSIS